MCGYIVSASMNSRKKIFQQVLAVAKNKIYVWNNRKFSSAIWCGVEMKAKDKYIVVRCWVLESRIKDVHPLSQ